MESPPDNEKGKGMEFSRNGQEILCQLEGFRPTPYKDQAGNWTIGYGSVIGYGPDGKFTIPYVSQEQALAMLMDHIVPLGHIIERLVAIPLTQNQFDALCIFVYNVGLTAFEESTMLKLLNAGDYVGAAAQWPRWNRIHGFPNPGLTNRRAREEVLFMEK